MNLVPVRPARATRGTARAVGAVLLAAAACAALGAPVLSPHPIDRQFAELLNAPPTVVRVRDSAGRLRAPFIYPWIRVSQLEQRYEEDRSRPVPLSWARGGLLVASSDARVPLLLLGADAYGRDVFSRLLHGARISLGLSLLAALGAVLLGAAVGAVAGYVGGATDDVLMRASDFVVVLPAMYVALAIRAALPLVLAWSTVFALLAAIFVIVGAPWVSRGVRGIVRTERHLDYAVAAASLGATHARLLARHLLPASFGFLAVQLTLLVPAFIVAEATLSYAGLGFPDSVSSWGTMLHDASSVRVFADFPWLLSPAAAIFLVVFALNLVLHGGTRPGGRSYETLL
jgi:peptide/nickel transport system permease protein